MTVNDFVLLETLYQYKNITKAAEALYLAQPTVSKRLRLIEEELGIVAVTRSKQGVEFTPAGEYLAMQATKINALFSETRQTLQQMNGARTLSLTVGATNTVLRSQLPDIIRKFQEENPRIEIHLTNDKSSRLVSSLEKGELDFGFTCGEPAYSGERILFRTEKLYLGCDETFKEKNLSKTSYIQYLTDPDTVAILKSWWESHFSKSFPNGMNVSSPEVALDLIRRGLGYSFFFQSQPEHSDKIKYIPLTNADGTAVIRNNWCLFEAGLIRNKPEAELFLNFLKIEISAK